MNRKEDVSEEQEEEEVDQITGDTSPSSTSEGDEGAMSDEDKEIVDQANTVDEDEDAHAYSEPEETETTSEEQIDGGDLQAVKPFNRPNIDVKRPELKPLDQNNTTPIRLNGMVPNVQTPSPRNLDPSLQTEIPTIQAVELEGTLNRDLQPDVSKQKEPILTRMRRELADIINVGSDLLELEDPFYDWIGGVPHGSGRPAVILHVSPEDADRSSLTFLERRLRDEYTQRRGGEPKAKRVRMVANKPKIPSLSNSIVTFDLTGEEWEVNTDIKPIRVERNSEDALEYIAEVVRTSYSGELGYLIINIPDSWRDPITTGDVIKRIRQRLLTGSADSVEEKRAENTDEESMLVALCEPIDLDEIRTQAHQYWFGGSKEVEDTIEEGLPQTVEECGEQFERGIRELDWLGTVLTEENDGESEEHYHLKSTIASSLAQSMYEEDLNSVKSLTEFAVKSLLGDEEPIQSECELESTNGKKITVDLKIKWERSLKSVIPTPDDIQPSHVALEVETGRGEGGANFRKIWHTIDRLENKIDLVGIVIPPRLLLQRRSQSSHLQTLVDIWNRKVKEGDVGKPQAILCIPVFDSAGNCTEIRRAETLIKEVYSE